MRKKSIHKDKKNRKKTYRKKTYRKKTNRGKSNLKNRYSRKNKQRGGMEFTDPDVAEELLEELVKKEEELMRVAEWAEGQVALIKELQEENERLEKEKEELQEATDVKLQMAKDFGEQLLERTQVVENDNVELKRQNAIFQEEAEEARVHAETLQSQLNSYIDGDEVRKEALLEKEGALNQRESEIEDELKEMRARIYGFEEKKKRLIAKLKGECEEEKLGLNEKNTALEKEKSELKESLDNASSFQEQFEGSRVELKKKKDELQEVIQALDNASTQNQTLTGENGKLKGNSEELRKCLDEIKSKLVEFNVSIARTDRPVYL